MKRSALFLFAAVFLNGMALAQQLNGGSVIACNPLQQGTTLLAYECAVAGGESWPPPDSINVGWFQYADANGGGQFSMTYKGQGCPTGCSFTGNFLWFAANKLDSMCEGYSGTLSGVFEAGSKKYPAKSAVYSQIACNFGGSFGNGYGDFTVEF